MRASIIDRFCNAEQRQRFLPKLTSMKWLASHLLTEPGLFSGAAALHTRTLLYGYHYVINGAKQFVSVARDSDVYAVMVRTQCR